MTDRPVNISGPTLLDQKHTAAPFRSPFHRIARNLFPYLLEESPVAIGSLRLIIFPP